MQCGDECVGTGQFLMPACCTASAFLYSCELSARYAAVKAPRWGQVFDLISIGGPKWLDECVGTGHFLMPACCMASVFMYSCELSARYAAVKAPRRGQVFDLISIGGPKWLDAREVNTSIH